MRLGERGARAALLALCALAPAVYLPRVLLGRGTPAPAQLPAAWMHLVVVTVGDARALGAAIDAAGAARPGASDGDREDGADDALDALVDLDHRAARIAAVFAAAPGAEAAAASFWTGRYPSSHGVTGPDRALGAGVWTLARGARGAGGRTAAFLARPLVSRAGIQGFDEVVEPGGPDAPGAPDALALAERAAEFLERTAGERALVWLHLDAPAPRELDAAIARLDRALAASDRAPETALALLALDTGPPRVTPGAPEADPPEAACLIALPGALCAGRRSDAQLSHVDVCGVLARLLGLRPPADAPLAARVELAWSALNGASPRQGVLFEGEETVWQRGDLRATLDPRTGAARAERAGAPLAGAEAAALLDEARRAVPTFARPATPHHSWSGSESSAEER